MAASEEDEIKPYDVDISKLYHRLCDVMDELYRDELAHPGFTNAGDTVLRRIPRFDKTHLALSLFPPSSGCGSAGAGRGAFPVRHAREVRSNPAAYGYPDDGRFASLLHPVYPLGEPDDCLSGRNSEDVVSDARRRHTTIHTDLHAGSYVFTGIVIRSRAYSQSARDPFCRLRYPYPHPALVNDLVARDATLAPGTFGAIDRTHPETCGDTAAMQRVPSEIGMYRECSGTNSPILTHNGRPILLHTALQITISSHSSKVGMSGWPGGDDLELDNNGVVYLYAPLERELRVGERSACIELSAPQMITMADASFGSVPPWGSSETTLYRGWGSKPNEETTPLAHVVEDMRQIVMASKRERGAGTQDDVADHMAMQSKAAPLVPLMGPLLKSLYLPYIKRDREGRRIYGLDSSAAESITAADTLFKSVVSYAVDALQYDATNETFHGCEEGLMSTSHLCDCAHLDGVIGAPTDAARGYDSYPRAARAIHARAKLSADAMQCYAPACDGGTRTRPVFTAFGRGHCPQLISECENYEDEARNRAAATNINEKITMNCGLGHPREAG